MNFFSFLFMKTEKWKEIAMKKEKMNERTLFSPPSCSVLVAFSSPRSMPVPRSYLRLHQKNSENIGIETNYEFMMTNYTRFGGVLFFLKFYHYKPVRLICNYVCLGIKFGFWIWLSLHEIIEDEWHICLCNIDLQH